MQPSSQTLWKIANAIRGENEPFDGGVARELLADVLQMGETENWSSTMNATGGVKDLFRPYATITTDEGEASRTLLPQDLLVETETGLRALAESSKNAFVQARIFETLWVRFKNRTDAFAAIEARFSCTDHLDAEADWPGVVQNLGRLTSLVMTLSVESERERLIAALEKAAGELRGSTRSFSFPVLADVTLNSLLAKPPYREVFTAERGARWEAWLREAASRDRGDPHHGHDALLVLQAWQRQWGRNTESMATRRELVAHLHDIARSADPALAPSHLQKALDFSLKFGLSDLVEQSRVALAAAVRQAASGFAQVSGTLRVPPELVTQLDALIHESGSVPAAVRQLAVFPGLLEVDRETIRLDVTKSLHDMPFIAHVPSVHYHPDGKITHVSQGFEGNVDKHVAFQVGVHLALIEVLLSRFLEQTFERFHASTLLDALAQWPHLLSPRVPLLAAASERFVSRDWISSGFIVVSLYEAILRDLLRAAGNSASKVDREGQIMDETLNSMLRSNAARAILGAAHCDLVAHVLCEPTLGWNLRNEIAHGTVRSEALTPTRVLLVWILLTRLTCFAVRAKASEPDSQCGEEVSKSAVPDGPPDATDGAERCKKVDAATSSTANDDAAEPG